MVSVGIDLDGVGLIIFDLLILFWTSTMSRESRLRHVTISYDSIVIYNLKRE